jgi:hypothetical protein
MRPLQAPRQLCLRESAAADRFPLLADFALMTLSTDQALVILLR